MQVALDLDDAEHDAFHRWLATTAVAVNPDDPHLEAGEAIRAMIRVTMRYADITDQVASQLRRERAAAKELPQLCFVPGAAAPGPRMLTQFSEARERPSKSRRRSDRAGHSTTTTESVLP